MPLPTSWREAHANAARMKREREGGQRVGAAPSVVRTRPCRGCGEQVREGSRLAPFCSDWCRRSVEVCEAEQRAARDTSQTGAA